MHQHIDVVGTARIDIGEADELVGVFSHRRGGGFVVALDADGVGIAQGEDDGLFHLRHRLVERIRVGLVRQLALAHPAVQRPVERQDVLFVVDVDVAVAIGAGGHGGSDQFVAATRGLCSDIRKSVSSV